MNKPKDLYLSPFRGFARGLRDEVLRYQGPFVYIDGLLLQATSPRRIATIGNETGRYPVAVIADTVLYTSPDPDPIASWPGGERWMGRELGRYKVEGSAPLKEHLEFLTGGTYKGKGAIVERVTGAE